MELACFEVERGRVELRAAEPKRAWMDGTPDAYAYRCTPLNVANGHGWEMLCPVGLEVVWNGGAGVDAVTVKLDEPGPAAFAESHFGSGIVTLNPLVIVRTPPEHDIWISGPPNSPKDGIAPLSAVVESDWSDFTFSMNWKLTRPGLPVRFERGEPFCFFFPVPRGLVGAMQPLVGVLEEFPRLNAAYWSLRMKRNTGAMLGESNKEKFQGWYTRGERSDGAPGPASHQTRAGAKPFTRR
jgi:hypothetical protein